VSQNLRPPGGKRRASYQHTGREICRAIEQRCHTNFCTLSACVIYVYCTLSSSSIVFYYSTFLFTVVNGRQITSIRNASALVCWLVCSYQYKTILQVEDKFSDFFGNGGHIILHKTH